MKVIETVKKWNKNKKAHSTSLTVFNMRRFCPHRCVARVMTHRGNREVCKNPRVRLARLRKMIKMFWLKRKVETFSRAIESGQSWIAGLRIVKLERKLLRGWWHSFGFYRIVQGEEAIRQSSMSSINATIQVPKLKMTRVHIPFTFRLLETGNNSFEGNFSEFPIVRGLFIVSRR